jgi:hypothetical protein
MREQKLKEYLENSLTVEEFMMDLENSQHKSGYDTTSFHIEQIEEGEFEITKSHLIKICDDFLPFLGLRRLPSGERRSLREEDFQ